MKRILQQILGVWVVGSIGLAASVAAQPAVTGGGPVWADLVTDRGDVAKTFYTAMFGWDFRQAGDHWDAVANGRTVARMIVRQRPAKAGAKPRWVGYLAVRDVKRAAMRAVDVGGKVLVEPRHVGRADFAVLADREGAVFGVARGAAVSGTPAVGAWVWLQLLSHDARQAATFYQKVAECEVVDNGTRRPGSWLLAGGGRTHGAVLTLPARHARLPSAWLPFVRVEDAGAAVRQAVRLGGKVLVAPRTDLLGGRVAVVEDPTGAAIGVMAWDGVDQQSTITKP